jgi:hypothetical protein
MESGMFAIKFENEFADVPLGRGGKYGSMNVELGKFSESVNDYIYSYGLRQILNDAMADKTDDDGAPLSDEAIVAKAQKRLDTLYSGELRTHRASSEPVDPVEREAYRMAREKIELQFKDLGVWPAKGRDKFQTAVDARRVATGNDPMTANEYIAAWLDRNAKVREAAKRIVRQRDVDAGEMV